jgi:signal transduction histidine kinase
MMTTRIRSAPDLASVAIQPERHRGWLPEQPLRVRVEWVVAAARVVLAAGALIAVLVDPPGGGGAIGALDLLAWYLVFSLAILVLVWEPTRFARGWAVGLHLFDLGTFTVLMVLTDGATSPFFVWLVFLLICAAIRWQVAGTLWTAAAVAVAYAGASLYTAYVYDRQEFAANAFIIHGVYLVVVTALLADWSSHQRQFSREVSRLADLPRSMSRDPRTVVTEVLASTAEILHAPRVLLAWDDPESGHLNLGLYAAGKLVWVQEPEAAYAGLVLPSLDGRAFQTPDARGVRRMITLTPRGFLRRECEPVDDRLRARFSMRAVQSWPLDGEIVRGRLFCLDKRRMSIDDLLVGEFVARLITSRLDSMYMFERLRGATALEERIRVARDLHDGLLQSQAGAALQLLAARRQLDRDPEVARQRLVEVQEQLERGELEMRSFIKGLRPVATTADPLSSTFRDRLRELGRRMERQWDVKVSIAIDGALNALPQELAEHVYRLVQEGIVNAGRHADASAVHVALSVVDGWAGGDEPDSSVQAFTRLQRVRRVRLTIVDDGRGFPFAGTYDLAALDQMARGPMTLQERVAELQGDLTLTSAPDFGTTLLITLPLVPA